MVKIKDRFSAYVFLGLLSVAAIVGLAGVWRVHSDGFITNFPDFMRGETALSFEKAYNGGLLTYEPSLSVWSSVNYTLFEEGNKGVLLGRDRWMFTDEEFASNGHAAAEYDAKIKYVSEVRKILAEKGARLLIAPVPAKARIYKENLGRYAYPAYKDALYGEFLQALTSYNVDVCDLEHPLSEAKASRQVFFRTDTHWTPDGAEAAAAAIGKCVALMYKRAPFSKAEFHMSQVEKPENLKGDLTRYVPLGMFADEAVWQDEYRVRNFEKKGGAASLEQSLFEEATPEVTLVGTSYSANTKWQFADALQYYLATDILNAADQGKGPFETMRKYLEDESFKTAPPKLVIWEIPERYLTMSFNPNDKTAH